MLKTQGYLHKINIFTQKLIIIISEYAIVSSFMVDNYRIFDYMKALLHKTKRVNIKYFKINHFFYRYKQPDINKKNWNSYFSKKYTTFLKSRNKEYDFLQERIELLGKSFTYVRKAKHDSLIFSNVRTYKYDNFFIIISQFCPSLSSKPVITNKNRVSLETPAQLHKIIQKYKTPYLDPHKPLL